MAAVEFTDHENLPIMTNQTKQAAKQSRAAFKDILNKPKSSIQHCNRNNIPAKKNIQKRVPLAAISITTDIYKVVGRCNVLSPPRRLSRDVELLEDFKYLDSLNTISCVDIDKLYQDTLDTSPESLSEDHLQCRQELEQQKCWLLEDYTDNIYIHLRRLEMMYKPRPDYMHRQPDISSTMRVILIDWLVSVSLEFKLHNETTYRAVSYIDRFLSIMSVVKTKLQLVGTAAMFIAAKFEEVHPPTVAELVHITNDTYTKVQLLRMEQILLKVLKYDISNPTSVTFLLKFCIDSDMDETATFLAMYLCELAMLEGNHFLHYLPSQMAAAAVAVARHNLSFNDCWPQKLQKTSGYSLKELSPIMLRQQKSFKESPTLPHKAIVKKYEQKRFKQVALLKPQLLELEY